MNWRERCQECPVGAGLLRENDRLRSQVGAAEALNRSYRMEVRNILNGSDERDRRLIDRNELRLQLGEVRNKTIDQYKRATRDWLFDEVFWSEQGVDALFAHIDRALKPAQDEYSGEDG